MSKPTNIINNFLQANPNAYITELHLTKAKSFTDRDGKQAIAPWYGSANANASQNISLGGITFSDTSRVFIPGAPKSTGTPSCNFWLPVGSDTSKLPESVFRVVLAESPDKHTVCKHLLGNGLLLNLEGIVDSFKSRTWAEAQDSVLASM